MKSNLLLLCILNSLLVFGDHPILFSRGTFIPSKETSLKVESLPKESAWHGIVQWNRNLTLEEQRLLQSSGAILVGYIPQYTYVLALPIGFQDHSGLLQQAAYINVLPPAFKLSAQLDEGSIPVYAQAGKEKVKVQLELFPQDPTFDVKAALNKIEGVEIISVEAQFNIVQAIVPIDQLPQIAATPWVLWIEPTSPDPISENVPGKNLHRSNMLQDGTRNLTGNGVRIGIWDGGLVGPHLDFAGRLTVLDQVAPSDHGTHVAGTMSGGGIIDPTARGMAPQSTVYSYDYSGSVNTEVANAISTYQIVISQNSWGYGDGFVNCTSKDPYNSNSRSQDINIANNPNFLHVHSAGNSQAVCSGGWGTTTGKSAKNMLVVANISSAEAINSSSSFGPVQDGRLKPEISGVGVNVYSTTPNNTYTGGYTGTSMATPGISGTAAQLHERFRQLNSNQDAPAALLKAVICNTAKDIGNVGPDYKHGFGVINGIRAVRAIESGRYYAGSVGETGNDGVNITVPSGAVRLKVMICWTDIPGLSNASPALVNDLDLTVTDPNSQVFQPWILSPASPANVATRGVDRLNNIEQVTIDNPTPGFYSLNVNGFAIPLGMQSFYLVWEIEEPSIELTYPNGNDNLTPGSSLTLHWNSTGITANQTLSYSTNGGSSWTTISSSILPSLNQFTWTLPTTIDAAKILFRVSSGALSDVSDAASDLIRTPAAFTIATGCVAGEVKFSWPAVAGATHYNVLRWDTLQGLWDTLGITTQTELTYQNALTTNEQWYTVVARNNALNVIGERSVAKLFMSTAGVSKSVLMGPITQVPSSVCKGTNASITADARLGRAPLANYTFATEAGKALHTFTNPVTVIGASADDSPVGPVSIGFSFNLGGQDFDACYVSPDGWIKLGSDVAADQYLNAVTSTSNTPKIYPAWDDYATGTNGSVVTETIGSEPNRIFIVQWFLTIPRNLTSAANSTFQLLLYESTQQIEFRYGAMGNSGSASSGITINASTFRSITFSSNTQSTSVANNSLTTPPATGRSYSFALPQPTSILWTPSTYLTATNTLSVLAANIQQTIQYKVKVTGADGCADSANHTVTVIPKPAVGFTINSSPQPVNNNTFVLNDTTSGLTSRQWRFGDGNTSVLTNPSKSFSATGQYTVKLIGFGANGCIDSVQKTVKVNQAAPTLGASNLQVVNRTQTGIQLSWQNGGGSQRYVLAKAGAISTATIEHGINYLANAQFGSGALLFDGSYVVYRGTGNTVNITGLSPMQTYYFAVVEVNGSGDSASVQAKPYLSGTGTTLPVSWLSINATLTREKTAKITWATASEENNERFEVWRSSDGTAWKPIGSVSGSGTTSRISYYQFTDVKFLPECKTCSYKILQVDFDGKSSWSNAVAVSADGIENELVIRPNPASSVFQIAIPYDYARIELVAFTGKVVREISEYRTGDQIWIDDIEDGYYFVKVYQHAELKSVTKFLKMR